jgi:hypothetical protein
MRARWEDFVTAGSDMDNVGGETKDISAETYQEMSTLLPVYMLQDNGARDVVLQLWTSRLH